MPIGRELFLTVSKTARPVVLAFAALLFALGYAQADPVISSSFGLGSIHVQPFQQGSLSDLSFSYSVTTPSFVNASTTGGGSVQISGPQFNYDPNTGTFRLDNFGGNITTIGPGTASVHFGETVSIGITNTSINSLQLAFTGGFFAPYTIGDSTVLTIIPPGEDLSTSWSLGVDGSGGSILSVTNHCPPHLISDFCGFADFESAGPFIVTTIAGGETLSYNFFVDATWSVSEVPEPSSLILLASMLALGFCPVPRTKYQT